MGGTRARRSAIWTMIMAVSAGALVSGSCLPAGHAAQPSKMILILDASGSMWGKLKGKSRIDHAKRVLGSFIDAVPGDAGPGLVIYGHRRKNDCKDVELVARPGALKRAALKKRVLAIRPKGHTPLALSIRRTAAAFKAEPGQFTILLVTDGIETCGGDPCKLVRELKAAGIKLTMHVVGFGVTPRDAPQLECIAKAGGGWYRAATDADELALAMRRATAKRPGAVTLEVGAFRNGERFHAVARVYKAGSKELLDQCQTSSSSPARFSLKPGRYDLTVEDHWGSKALKALERIAVRARKVTKKRVDFDLATLEVQALQGRTHLQTVVTVYRAGTKEQVATHQTTSRGGTRLTLVPGVYDLLVDDHWRSKVKIWLRGVKLKGGATVVKRAMFTLGTLKVESLLKGKPIKTVVTVFRAGTRQEVTQQQTGWSTGASFSLIPGRYDLRVKDPWRTKKEAWIRGVTVKANQSSTRRAELGQ